MRNVELRDAARGAGVKLWQIADGLGIADANFSRKLRHELPETEKEKILEMIKQAPAERGEN